MQNSIFKTSCTYFKGEDLPLLIQYLYKVTQLYSFQLMRLFSCHFRARGNLIRAWRWAVEKVNGLKAQMQLSRDLNSQLELHDMDRISMLHITLLVIFSNQLMMLWYNTVFAQYSSYQKKNKKKPPTKNKQKNPICDGSCYCHYLSTHRKQIMSTFWDVLMEHNKKS